jgi:hypothetical protein
MPTATTPKRRAAPTTMRASYSIPTKTLQGFNATVPVGDRSEVISRLMTIALAEKEAALEKIAADFMADPANAECIADDALWDVVANDGLTGL